MIRQLFLGLACLASPAGVAAEQVAEIIRPPELRPLGSLALPALSAAVPVGAAGCVVLGYHVMPDGSVANPQMLKGAFTRDVSEDLREVFSRGVIAAATQWRYQLPDRDDEVASYETETVGFARDGADGPRYVVGANQQAEPLRAVCRIDDLPAWGEQNAIPLEQAQVRNGDKVILRTPGEPFARWLPKATRPPRFPLDGHQLGVNACVLVGFVVRSDGSVDSLKILSSEFSPRPAPRIREMFENASVLSFADRTYAPGPDNLDRIAEFRQEPVTFRVDGSGGGPECKPLDPETLLQSSVFDKPGAP